MIAMLTGLVAEKNADSVILEVGGIGYGIFVSQTDLDQLREGQEQRLYIYEHIREVAHDLYGFKEQFTQVLFEQLLNVSGVGPKVALAILGLGPLERVRSAIAAGDSVYVTRAVGVGKRLAERIVVDLHDKLGPAVGSMATDAGDDALSALVALGYSRSQAIDALSGLDKQLSTEQRVKAALKVLA